MIASPCRAQSTLIPVTARTGMVFNHAGTRLYIATSDGFVRPYNLSTGQLESPYNIGGSLAGLDIATDDSFLLIAQGNTTSSAGSFIRLDLGSGGVTNINYDFANPSEGGGSEVAITSRGFALVTTQTTLRQIDLATNSIAIRTDAPAGNGNIGGVGAHCAIPRSADREVIYFVQREAPSAPIFTYRASTDTFGPVFYTNRYYLTGAHAAVNRNGTLLSTRIEAAASIDSSSGYQFLAGFNALDGPVAFDATKDVFYGTISSTDQLIAYDTNTHAELFRFDIGEHQNAGTGSLAASQDGRYLALTTPSGVRLFAMPSPIPSPTLPTPTLATRRDMVFDHSGQFLYLSTLTGLIERYNLATHQIDEVFNIGGLLNGLDIASDDSFLLVAQGIPGVAQGAVHRLDLSDGSLKNINYPLKTGPESSDGAWDVAICSNGLALFTTGQNTFIRQIDLASDAVSPRNDGRTIVGNTQVARSADGKRLYFLQTTTMSGPAFTYDSETNAFGPATTTEYTFFSGASHAVNRDGSLLATRVNAVASLDTAPEFTYVRGFSRLDGGVAFDAMSDTFYAVSTSADAIIAYRTENFDELFRIDLAQPIAAGVVPFGLGTLVASADGHFLALETATGIQVVSIPSPIPAPTPSPSPSFGTARDLVFDHSGRYLYVSNWEGFIQRYNLASGVLDRSYNLGGSLNGIDISLDDSFLLVAQHVKGVAQGMFQKIDLNSGNVAAIPYPLAFAESGGRDVAMAANGKAIVTTELEGFGWVPLREIYGNQIRIRQDAPGVARPGYVDSDTSSARSADGSVLFLRSAVQADAFTYNASTDTFGPFAQLFGSIAAVNRNGTMVATEAFFMTQLKTLPDFAALHTFNFLQGGVAFDLLHDTLYGLNGNDQIIAYETAAFAEKFRISIGEHINPNPSRLGPGRLVANQNTLAVITPSTVRIFPIPTPAPIPSATPVISVSVSTGSVTEGGTAIFTISASAQTQRPISVGFSMSGKATIGTDFTLSSPGPVTIPNGQNSVAVTLSATGDHVKERNESATMTLNPGAGYSFGGTPGKKKKVKPPAATVSFIDAP